MKFKTILTFCVSVLAFASGQVVLLQAQVFTENFGSLANGTTLTTANTNFTYVRTSTGTGAVDPNAINPSNFGAGSSGFLQGPSGSGSLTGVGIQNTLTSSDVYTMSVDFRLSSVASGDIVFGVGSGDRFTGNSTFTTAQGLFWLQSDNGNFERRTSGGWSDIGGGTALADATNYSLHIVANGSGSLLSYTGGSVAANTMNIYLNGVLLDNNVAVTTAGLFADGFRIYSVEGTGIEIDNINLWNAAVAPVPEPSTYALIFGSLILAVVLWRKRLGAK